MKNYQRGPEKDVAFRAFEDLEVYKNPRQFRKSMDGVTKKLPQFEKYELPSQIRRASVSLTSNIAEWHGRCHYLEQLKFLFQSRGSLQKLIDDINVCDDERYLPEAEILGAEGADKRSAAFTERLCSRSSQSKIRLDLGGSGSPRRG